MDFSFYLFLSLIVSLYNIFDSGDLVVLCEFVRVLSMV